MHISILLLLLLLITLAHIYFVMVSRYYGPTFYLLGSTCTEWTQSSHHHPLPVPYPPTYPVPGITPSSRRWFPHPPPLTLTPSLLHSLDAWRGKPATSQ